MAEVIGAAYVQIAADTKALESGLAQAEALTRAKVTNMESATNRAMSGTSNFSQAEIRKTGMAFSRMSALVGSEAGAVGRGISLIGMALYSLPVAAAAAGAMLVGWLVSSYKETRRLREETERLTIAYDLQAESAKKIAKGTEGQRAAFKEIEKVTGNVRIAEEAWNTIRDLTIAGLYSEKEAIALVTKSKEGLKAATMGFLPEQKAEVDVIDAVAKSIQYQREKLEKLRAAAGLKPGEEKPAGIFGIQTLPVQRATEAEETLKRLEKDYENLGGAARKVALEQEAALNAQVDAEVKALKYKKDFFTPAALAPSKKAQEEILTGIREREKEETDLQVELDKLDKMAFENQKKHKAEIEEIDKRMWLGQREQQLENYRSQIDALEGEKKTHKDTLDEMLEKRRENVEKQRAEMGEWMAPAQIWRQIQTGEFQVKIAEREERRFESEARKENTITLKQLDSRIAELTSVIKDFSQGN